MKLLLVYGEQDAGKTTTCVRLYTTLKGFDSAVQYYEIFPWGDFKSILQLNNTKIAIYSAGDEKQHLKSAIEFGMSWECEVLIAVVRSQTHYNELLKDLTCGEDFFWFILDKGNDNTEKDLYEHRIVIKLFNEICKIANLLE